MSATNTAGFHEQLVKADIRDLVCPAYDSDESIALKGASAAQVAFAACMRIKRLEDWEPDLPSDVYRAVLGIADATWWLANQHKDSGDIGWPASWIKKGEHQAELDEAPLTPVQSSRAKAVSHMAESKPKAISGVDIAEFDQFAHKACQSPELAYLAMMALLFRQTKDKRILAKFTEARQKIAAHLSAIDTIVGPIE